MTRFGKIEFTTICFLIFLCPSAASAQGRSDSDYLHETEDKAPTMLLKGAIQRVSRPSSKSSLEQSETDNGNSTSNQINGQIDSSSEKLTEEVSIDWDSWRNKVTRSIWARFCELLNGGDAFMFGNMVIKLGNAPVPRFPLGTSASYSFDVNSERQLSNVRITDSSGNQQFDKLILRSVQSIDGKQFLKFPKGSKRNLVSASAKLFTTKHGSFTKISFGDIERYQQTTVQQP